MLLVVDLSYMVFIIPRWLSGKESAHQCKTAGWIPGSGRSPGGGHGNPLQCSCLENPMDRRAWQATVHRLAKSWTQLKQFSMHVQTQRWMASAMASVNLWLTLVNVSKLGTIRNHKEDDKYPSFYHPDLNSWMSILPHFSTHIHPLT